MRAVSSGSEETTWLQDYCKLMPSTAGTWFVVKAVQFVESGKGYLLSLIEHADLDSPELCKAFVWKNSPQGQLVRDLLEESYLMLPKAAEVVAFPLLLVEGTTGKQFKVGIDDIPAASDDDKLFFSSHALEPGGTATLKKSMTQAPSSRSRRG